MLRSSLPRRSSARCLQSLCRVGRAAKRLSLAVPLLLILGAFGQPGLLHAQEPAPEHQMYRVEMTEGKVLIGTLVLKNDEQVVLKTRELGEVTLKRANIESMAKVDPARIRNGEYWFENPQSTRYFFGPSAIGLRGGEGYYQNTWVVFNNVNYGVSNNVSIGAGTVPIFLFGADAIPFWVLPKASISTPQTNLHFAGGAVLGGVIGEESTSIGLLYGNTTVGSRDHNATLGVGYGYADGEIADTPAIHISGMTRISKTTYLITENYFVPAFDGSVVSVGFRWAPKNFALDAALFRPLEETGDFIGFPWLSVTIPFGG